MSTDPVTPTCGKKSTHPTPWGVSNLATATALTTLVDSWAQQMETGEDALALVMDQSMTYDLVYHKILLLKLQAIGLDPCSIKLMTSYLSAEAAIRPSGRFRVPSPPYRAMICDSRFSNVLYPLHPIDPRFTTNL